MTGNGVLRWAATCGLALVVLACGTPAPTPGDDAGGGGHDANVTRCATNTDCDDGMFCNGPETCMPTDSTADAAGCVHTSPCMASQRCSEAEDRCLTQCAVAPDADGDGADSAACGGTDCDDADAHRFPTNPEVCDAAGHDEDCDATTFGTRDSDGDGFVSNACCNTEGTAMHCGTDCNDTRLDAHPGATEACEGVDNDCDGSIDEMLLLLEWPDRDFDLHGDEMDTTGQMVCPGTPGYSTVHDDCNDDSPVQHRAQLELCDLIDNDCDGTVDEAPVSITWYPDADGDLFGAPSAGVVVSCAPVDGYSTRSSDCNDHDAMVHPGAREICNGVDDDCNGYANAGGLGPGDTEDDDGDQYADVVCGGNDCDDASADVNPGAQELCNGIDDDCDSVVDGASANASWYLDRDHDGYGDMALPAIMACEPQPGRVPRGGDCDDGDASIHPRVPDFCDDIDADCDGSIDENGVRFAFFPDADGDGWGDPAIAGVVFRCTRPAGTSAQPGDCDDTRGTRYPGAHEDCQGLDDDCDAQIDEDSDQMWYPDGDHDGHGAGTPILACMTPVGYSLLSDDCDDLNGGNFPGNPEICNGRDEDCDAMIDDGANTYCASFPRASASVCTAGACVVSCDSSYANCNGVLTDGCEVNTDRSPTYCGSCTSACHPADTCGIGTLATCDVSPVVAISGGDYFGLALRANGAVAAWGEGTTFWQTTSAIDQPAPIDTGLSGITQVEAGDVHACALTVARHVVCWGGNGYGQLGFGPHVMARGPLEVPGITNATRISSGGLHTCALLSTGEIMCWGRNANGQLGDGSNTDRAPGLVAGINDAVDVTTGAAHTCALRGVAGSRYVSCWGTNAYGQLGLGYTGAPELNMPGGPVMGLPTNLASLAQGPGGSDVNFVLTTDGRVYSWGYGGYGVLGTGTSTGSPTASPISSLSGVIELSHAYDTACARIRGSVAGQSEVWCWGYAVAGNPWMDGTTTSVQTTPIRAGTVGDRVADAVAIYVGYRLWCAVRANGGVTCMGADTGGAMGNGLPLANVAAPTAVLNLP